MDKKKIIQALRQILADSYALYLKTQNYHWNVEGPNFKSIHELLEEQYTDLAGAIDQIAELIRALGAKAPGNWMTYESLTKIQPGDESAHADAMLMHLVQDHQLMQDALKSGVDISNAQNDDVTAGILIERMTIHRKNQWFLQSMLGKNENKPL